MGSDLISTIEDRERQVYHLRRGGMGFPEIADRVGTTRHDVMLLFRNFQKKVVAAIGPEDRAGLIELEVDRLDALQHAVWDQAMAGDLKAAQVALNIIHQRSKLKGLEQASVQDVSSLANVLIVGESQQGFIDALNSGRRKLTSTPGDDGGVAEENP
jgi:hypothetical protein